MKVTEEMVEAALSARFKDLPGHWSVGLTEGTARIEHMKAEQMLNAALSEATVEPVAWMWEEPRANGCEETCVGVLEPQKGIIPIYNVRPLYASPPKEAAMPSELVERLRKDVDRAFAFAVEVVQQRKNTPWTERWEAEFKALAKSQAEAADTIEAQATQITELETELATIKQGLEDAGFDMEALGDE